LRYLPEVAIGLDERPLQRLDQRPRWIVCDEMARELHRDMLCRRRMAGEIGQHGATLRQAGIAIVLADDRLRSGLVHARMEQKFAAMFRVKAGIANCPAS